MRWCLAELEHMQRGVPPRESSFALEALDSERFIRLSIGEEDQGCSISHFEQIFVILRPDGIRHSEEPFLVSGSVGARIAYPQRTEAPSHCVATTLVNRRVVMPFVCHARIHHYNQQGRQSVVPCAAESVTIFIVTPPKTAVVRNQGEMGISVLPPT